MITAIYKEHENEILRQRMEKLLDMRGPTAWLSQHVLGVTPLEPGFKRVRVVPQLGRLQWAEGAYPTPRGTIKVRHERQADGSVKSDIQAPVGIVVERK